MMLKLLKFSLFLSLCFAREFFLITDFRKVWSLSRVWTGQLGKTLYIRFLLLLPSIRDLLHGLFETTSLSFMSCLREEVTHSCQTSRRFDLEMWHTNMCGKQSDFLPAWVALMLVIMMLFLSRGLRTDRVQQSTSDLLESWESLDNVIENTAKQILTHQFCLMLVVHAQTCWFNHICKSESFRL